MRIVVSIDASRIREPRAVALAARGFLEGVVAVNRIMLREAKRAGTPFPPLYRSGVQFRPEPWQGRLEEFADIATVYKRGFGDCDDLAGIRVAELREEGVDAGLKIYWRDLPPRKGRPLRERVLYHVQVRLPDGRVEDPTRRLAG